MFHEEHTSSITPTTPKTDDSYLVSAFNSAQHARISVAVDFENMLQRFLALALLETSFLVQGHTPKGILVDVDIFGGVDDVGALALANVFHNCGLANLLGVFINTPSRYGALASNVSLFHV